MYLYQTFAYNHSQCLEKPKKQKAKAYFETGEPSKEMAGTDQVQAVSSVPLVSSIYFL